MRERRAASPGCPVRYRETDPDGRDDDLLETFREGDRVRIGRRRAPVDQVRRHLVTGGVDAGRNRTARHDAIVTAMTQLAPWRTGASVFCDRPEWAEARAAVADLVERCRRVRPPADLPTTPTGVRSPIGYDQGVRWRVAKR
jgi:hypothetical protein